MENSFKQKTVLVTGASSGIGQATALAFAKLGANVVIADIQEANETLKMLSKYDGKALFVQCDVAKEEEVELLVKKIVSEYRTLDIAFNNAGIEGHANLLQDITAVDFDRTISVNLKGVFYGMKYQLRTMLKQGHGVIVNCASIAGLVGF